MRKRDEELYHLEQAGYQLTATSGDFELWVKPGNPRDFRVIRACPSAPANVVDALIEELERMDSAP